MPDLAQLRARIGALEGLPRLAAGGSAEAIPLGVAAIDDCLPWGGLGREQPVVLPQMTMGEQVVEDYAHLSLSLKTHPLALMRARLAAEGIIPAGALRRRGDGRICTRGSGRRC